jgi:hypothetical protein
MPTARFVTSAVRVRTFDFSLKVSVRQSVMKPPVHDFDPGSPPRTTLMGGGGLTGSSARFRAAAAAFFARLRPGAKAFRCAFIAIGLSSSCGALSFFDFRPVQAAHEHFVFFFIYSPLRMIDQKGVLTAGNWAAWRFLHPRVGILEHIDDLTEHLRERTPGGEVWAVMVHWVALDLFCPPSFSTHHHRARSAGACRVSRVVTQRAFFGRARCWPRRA